MTRLTDLPGATQNGRATAPIHEPSDHEELIAFLERDQIVADTSVPVPPAQLSAAVRAGLWALRVFVVVVSLMVVYAFVHKL